MMPVVFTQSFVARHKATVVSSETTGLIRRWQMYLYSKSKWCLNIVNDCLQTKFHGEWLPMLSADKAFSQAADVHGT